MSIPICVIEDDVIFYLLQLNAMFLLCCLHFSILYLAQFGILLALARFAVQLLSSIPSSLYPVKLQCMQWKLRLYKGLSHWLKVARDDLWVIWSNPHYSPASPTPPVRSAPLHNRWGWACLAIQVCLKTLQGIGDGNVWPRLSASTVVFHYVLTLGRLTGVHPHQHLICVMATMQSSYLWFPFHSLLMRILQLQGFRRLRPWLHLKNACPEIISLPNLTYII